MRLSRPKTYNIADLQHRRWFEDLFKAFNQNISFGTDIGSDDQNIQGRMIEVADSGTANSSITITHNLGYIPKFYDVKYISIATNIFDFGTPWTTTQIFLASSIAHVKFRVFIH